MYNRRGRVICVAAIWVVAAIGMACGAGLLWEAVLVTVLTLLVLIGLRYIEPFIIPARSSLHVLQIEVAPTEGEQDISHIYAICAHNSIKIVNTTVRKADPLVQVKLTCKVENRKALPHLLDALHNLPEVRMVEIDMDGVEKK